MMMSIEETAEIVEKINELILSLDIDRIEQSLKRLKEERSNFESFGMLMNPVGANERLDTMNAITQKLKVLIDWSIADKKLQDSQGKFYKARTLSSLF